MSADQIVALLTSIATLVNSMILWPIVKGLKNTQKDHGERLEKLEDR